MHSHRPSEPVRVARNITLTTPTSLVAALSRIRLRSVFNPYADRCPGHDRYDAARIRRRNLVRYLESALGTYDSLVSEMVIGTADDLIARSVPPYQQAQFKI
jgi:hypothetical protein